MLGAALFTVAAQLAIPLLTKGVIDGAITDTGAGCSSRSAWLRSASGPRRPRAC